MAASADEIGVVDVVPRVAGRVEGFDHQCGRPRIVEADAQAGDRPLPSGKVIDANHRAVFDHVGRQFPAAAAHGHDRVRSPSAAGGSEVGPPLGRELRLILGGPLDVTVRPLQPRRPPVEPQPRRDPGVDRERRCLGDRPRFGQFEIPALVTDIVPSPAGQLPPVGLGRGRVVAGNTRAAEMPPDPARLHPQRERPALCVRRAVVLVSVDVALRVHRPPSQRRCPAVPHCFQLAPAAHRRPQRRHGHPFVPQGDQGPGRLVMQPEQASQTVHLLLVAGHDEPREVVRDRRSSGRRGLKQRRPVAEDDGDDESFSQEHVGALGGR